MGIYAEVLVGGEIAFGDALLAPTRNLDRLTQG